MNDLLQVARDLQFFCDQKKWRSCIIGGIAVQRWGQPRVTQDVDITLLTGFGSEEDYVETLLAHYKARIGNAAEFAQRNRVLLLEAPSGIGMDISLGALPFEESTIARATKFEYAPGLVLRTCSAEDLIVMKLFAGRPLDLNDVRTVVLRNKTKLDWTYIETQLAPLAELKEDPDVLKNLARLKSV